MTRRQEYQPFDLEVSEAADISAEFWGSSRSWTPRAVDADGVPLVDDRPTGSLRAIASGIGNSRSRRDHPTRRGSSSFERTRSHGIVRPRIEPAPDEIARYEASLGELAAGWVDEDWLDTTLPVTRPVARIDRDARPPRPEFEEDAELIPLTPRRRPAPRSTIDPLLGRLGVIALVGAGLMLVATGFRSNGDPSGVTDEVPASVAQAPAGIQAETGAAGTTATGAPGTAAATLAATTITDPVSTSQSSPSGSDSIAASTVASTQAATVATDVREDVPSTAPATTEALPAEVATVSQQALRVALECEMTYIAGHGDSWYRIADEAGVSPGEVVDANLAGLDTPIYPGDEVCLPAGSRMPTTPAPPTTVPPTDAPATTVAPTSAPTTVPSSGPTTPAQVQQLIRDIWPDDLEEHALEIAWRESNYIATAHNGWCCYGVFQIYYTAHQSWLDDYGIDSANDLLDARKNITAAYALYQRAGGWGPWGG